MCWFLTVAVTANAARLLPQPSRAPDLRARPQVNASIVAALADVARLPKDVALWSIERNGCSCDLISKKQRGEYDVRVDVRELLARIVEETGKPLAFVFHTYRGPIDEAFSILSGPRLTPGELREASRSFPADSLCVVRDIPPRPQP